MQSNNIQELMKQRQKEIEKEKNQIIYGLIVIGIGLVFCILAWRVDDLYGAALGGGIIIGVILRYSRFCFAAAFRNPFVSGNTRVMRAVILGLIVSTIGFGLIQSGYIPGLESSYIDIPGAVQGVGVRVMVGGFIFGIGMVLAGGCASGILMRIGEGHTVHWVVLLGFIIGTLLGAKDYDFWYQLQMTTEKVIYFPDYLDLRLVVLMQVIVLSILYKLAWWYEKKQIKKL